LAKITRISCPGCSSSLDIPKDGREYFFCTYCGNRVLVEDETRKKIEITKVEKRDVPQIDCGVCGGTIFSQEQSKFKCKRCGKIACKNCYDFTLNFCKDCWKELNYNKLRKFLRISIVCFFTLTLIGFISIYLNSKQVEWASVVFALSFLVGILVFFWMLVNLYRFSIFKKTYFLK
jgi:DNA-directed RNA polymerase subunit RPC12/RpoP